MDCTGADSKSSDSNPSGSEGILQTLVEGFSNLGNKVTAGFEGLVEDNQEIKAALDAAKNDQPSAKPPPVVSSSAIFNFCKTYVWLISLLQLTVWGTTSNGSSLSKDHVAPKNSDLEKKLEIHRIATENWLAEKDSMSKEHAELEKKMRSTDYRNKELQKRNSKLSTQLQEATSKSQEDEELVKNLRAEILQTRVFITKAGGNEPAERDVDLISSFVALKSKIQKIVHKHYLVEPSRIPTIPRMNASNEQIKLSKLWGHGLNASQLKKRVRAQIFGTIDEWIFWKPSFGLLGISEFELPLRDFEVRLTQMQVGM